jgi:hypothetical protein
MLKSFRVGWASQLVLSAWLHRIVNGGAEVEARPAGVAAIDREYAVGSGRCSREEQEYGGRRITVLRLRAEDQESLPWRSIAVRSQSSSSLARKRVNSRSAVPARSSACSAR